MQQWRKQRQRELRYNKALLGNCKRRLNAIAIKCGAIKEEELSGTGNTGKGGVGGGDGATTSAGRYAMLSEPDPSEPTTSNGGHHGPRARFDKVSFVNGKGNVNANGTFDRVASVGLQGGGELEEKIQGRRAQIDQQQAVLSDMVGNCHDIIDRLHNQALDIKAELKTQEVCLDETKNRMEKAMDTLTDLNARMRKFTQKTMKPQNCVLNFICLLVLIAMVGVLLTQLPIPLPF